MELAKERSGIFEDDAERSKLVKACQVVANKLNRRLSPKLIVTFLFLGYVNKADR